jgi:hypothetical protein
MSDNGRVGLVRSVSDKLLTVLPPAFLMLIIINAISLAAIFWIVHQNAEARNVLLTEIVKDCLLNK